MSSRLTPLGIPCQDASASDYLIFVRLAHDRRLVLVVFLLVLVLFVFIRISGRHRVACDHDGTPVDQIGGTFLGNA